MPASGLAAVREDVPLETVDRCALCGSVRFRTAFEEPPYSVRRCVKCGLAWVSPRLSERALRAMYGEDSYWRSESPKTLGYHDYRGAEELYLRTFRKRLRFALGKRPRSGRALDVGCAAGFCMQALADLGFEAYGVEVSPTIAAHASRRFGFETVHVGTLSTAPFAEGSFDLITLWDVVEHAVDPAALLVQARELLRPGGLLVLETQNIDSLFARALGRRWHHYKHAEHIYHFNRSTLRRLLGATGFEVDRLTPRLGGKYVSLQFIAERAGRIHPSLSAALRPPGALRSVSLYCNVMDELIAVAHRER